MEFILPYPPSVNHYYRRVGPRTLISREGRAYRRYVRTLLGGSGRSIDQRIALSIAAHPPDRRRRDLDNLLKCTQDSMEHAGVFRDDSQIDWLDIRRREPVQRGKLIVRLETFPLRRCPVCGRSYPTAKDVLR